jgi:putative hydrolase of the HAD superfamily
LWNTLFVEVAPAISHDRAVLLSRSLNRMGTSITNAEVESAIAEAWRCHRQLWSQGTYFQNKEAAEMIGKRLSLPPEISPSIVEEALEYMYPSEKLQPCDDLHKLLSDLTTAGLRLGLISDTGFTPGRTLVERFRELGIAKYFSGFSFSDELGVFKPDSRIFEHSLTYLHCRPEEATHVGDLWRNDVAGARQAGFLTVRYRAWNDDTPSENDADFVSNSHDETREWILNRS